MLVVLAVLSLLLPRSECERIAAEDFGDARWVWPSELGCPTNTVVEFRREFSAESSGKARLAIAADTVYALSLNGKRIYTGRFPDVPPERFYDVLDVEVAKGSNDLRVSLYVQGVDSFQHLPGDPGLMFALRAEGVSARSGEGMVWRVSSAHRAEGVPMLTSQLGFTFEYDATALEGSWRRIGADDARRGAGAFTLRRRPVPRVEILPEVAERIVAQGTLDATPLPREVAKGMDATKMSPVAREEFFLADGRSVNEKCFGTGFYVIADLGREEAGFLSLDIDTDEGAVIDIGHAEHMENGRIRTHIRTRNFAGRYHARAGRQSFFRWERRMAGRFIQLHVRGVRSHFRINRISLKPALVPVEVREAPKGLSPRQEEIYRVSVRTLRLCMHEHFEDCPWREQALYGNDARNQMLCGYRAFGGDWAFPELSMWLLSKGLGRDGWLEMCMPAKISITIPSFTFCWIMSVDDNLRHRGNVEFVRAMMPTLTRILDARLAEMRDGLLPCPEGPRYWQFYEWAPELDGRRNMDAAKAGTPRLESPLNLFFVLALESGARCADAVGEAAAARRWREAAAVVRGRVTGRFWNEGKLQMETADGVKVASELVQALALLADAVPEKSRSAVVQKLSAPSEWTEVTISQALYKYEALRTAGEDGARAARASLDGIWSEMLDKGATSFWEMREGWPAFSEAGSLCHGWSAIPVYFYSTSGR